ncbi:TadE/TadG family type IV pilus assembly protein [Nitratireductor sp. GISD-1A_MAKvit]|uniref:TadE/TadG family type IV pilus assembly protein n=1 Tax=Nitratireductor sp. GISD-1A_MAKvit TaxID=3234198 RepID=UPI003466C106
MMRNRITDSPRNGIMIAIGAFLRDRRGIAATEFVIVLPILLAFYFLTMEFSQAIDTSKKVSRAASMVGDLIAQQPSISPGEVDAIMKIGSAILKPYNRSMPTVTVTAIEITDEEDPKVKVVWSRELRNGSPQPGAPKGSNATVPNDLKKRGTFYIKSSTSLGYKPRLAWSSEGAKAAGLTAMLSLDNLPLSESYYLRPRMSRTIPCADC